RSRAQRGAAARQRHGGARGGGRAAPAPLQPRWQLTPLMRVGARRRALALAQAELMAELLGGAEIVPMITAGDRESRRGSDQSSYAGDANRPPAENRTGEPPASDKSRWVIELEHALSSGEIDLAVHSAK